MLRSALRITVVHGPGVIRRDAVRGVGQTRNRRAVCRAHRRCRRGRRTTSLRKASNVARRVVDSILGSGS